MPLKPFNFGVVTKRILPFKALKNSSALSLDLNHFLDLATWAAKENLLEEVSFYDDDLLAWSPETANDYKDKNNQIFKQLADVKAKLDKAEIAVSSITLDLVSNPVFAHGAFTNKDAKIRELARKKAERALEIGRALNASLFIYEGDSDGFDSPFTVAWQDAWKRLAAGLDAVSLYANNQQMTNYRGGCIAPKQSANYLYGFLNTPSDALNIIHCLLKDRNFWGIVPAMAQLQAQGWEKAPSAIANVIGARRLAMLKVGGGVHRLATRAPHPIIGTANINETVQLFWLLDKMNWKGAVEYDNSASISDAKSNNDELTCKQFITNCATALTVALQLAEKVKNDELDELTPSEADLMAATLLGTLDVDQVIFRSIKHLPPTFETPKPQQQQNNNQQQKQNGQQQKQQQNNNQQQQQQKQNNNNQQQKQNGQQRQNNNPKRQQQDRQERPRQDRQQHDAPKQQPAEQVPVAEVPTPQPVVETPVVKEVAEIPAPQPVVEAPVVEAPVAQETSTAQPVVEAPVVEAPAVEAPAVKEVAEAPAPQQVVEAPAPEEVPVPAVEPAPAQDEDAAVPQAEDEIPFLPDEKKPKARSRAPRRQPSKPRATKTAKTTTTKRTSKKATDTPPADA